MSDYDYLNARVRGMSTALLTPEFYEQILLAEGEDLLVDSLLSSPYGAELRETLADHRGVEAVELALRRNVRACFSIVLSLAPPEPARLLSIQLDLWDTANVLALVRGKVTGAEPGEIVAGVLPVGEFDNAQLAELAAEPDLRSLADALTTWDYRFAYELRRAIRGYGESPDLPALESAVNDAYFRWAFAALDPEDENQRIVLRMLRMQIDLANVRMALDRVRHRIRGEETGPEPSLPGGMLGAAALRELAGSGSLVEAFETLEGTYFSPGIEKGILAFGGAGVLGVMERFLEVVVIQTGCRLFRLDPLGIGVPLGFIWRKYSEFLNLRILVRGKAYRMPAGTIREELMLA